MKRALFASIIAALALAFAAPGVAQAQNKGKKVSKKVKTYDFSGDTIDGALVKPNGVQVDARTFASHTSLIKIRTNFIKEILKSAEDL